MAAPIPPRKSTSLTDATHVLAQDGTHGFSVLHKPYSAEQLGRLLRQVTAPKRDALSRR